MMHASDNYVYTPVILPLDPTANATHPPMRHSPPSGVTGPRALNLSGFSTRRYMEPLNIVIPAVNNPAATCRVG